MLYAVREANAGCFQSVHRGITITYGKAERSLARVPSAELQQGNGALPGGPGVRTSEGQVADLSIELRWHDHTSSCCSKH